MKTKGTRSPLILAQKETIAKASPYKFPKGAVLVDLVGFDLDGYVYVYENSSPTCELYQCLASSLKTFYLLEDNPDVKLKLEDVEVGLIVACEKDGEIIRGRIREIDSNTRMIKVKDVDNQKSSILSEHQIFRMNDKFLLVPFRAVRCIMYGLEMLIETRYIYDAISKLKKSGLRLKAIDVAPSGQESMPILMILHNDFTSEERFQEPFSLRIIQWISRMVSQRIHKMHSESEARVEISHYDKNGYLWLHFCDLIDLVNNIVQVHRPSTKEPLTERNLDMLIEHHKRSGIFLAKFEQDDEYYRAKILNFTSDSEVSVHFIDYGNKSLTQLNDLIPIIEKDSILNHVPPLAFKVHLNQVEFLSPKEDIIKIEKGSLTLKISDASSLAKEDKNKNFPEIELYGIQNGVKIHINSILKEKEKVQKERISQLKISTSPPSSSSSSSMEIVDTKLERMKPIGSEIKSESPKLRKWTSEELRSFSKATEKIEPIIPSDQNRGLFIISFNENSRKKFSTLHNYSGIEKLADFENSMIKYYKNNQNILNKEYLKEKSYYAAFINRSCFRVTILDDMNHERERYEEVDVLLIDHAVIRKIKIKNLRILSSQFYSLPYQSFFGLLIDPRDKGKKASFSTLPTRVDFRPAFDVNRGPLEVKIVTRNFIPNIGGEILSFIILKK